MKLLMNRERFDRVPETWRRWCWRYRRRILVLGTLAGVYVGVQTVDFLLERYLLDSSFFQSGPLKMTRRHFQQPSENLFTWSNFDKFLDKVTEHKPGILGQKWPYVALIILYLGLSVFVFLRITEPDEAAKRETRGDSGRDPPENPS